MWLGGRARRRTRTTSRPVADCRMARTPESPAQYVQPIMSPTSVRRTGSGWPMCPSRTGVAADLLCRGRTAHGRTPAVSAARAGAQRRARPSRRMAGSLAHDVAPAVPATLDIYILDLAIAGPHCASPMTRPSIPNPPGRRMARRCTSASDRGGATADLLGRRPPAGAKRDAASASASSYAARPSGCPPDGRKLLAVDDAGGHWFPSSCVLDLASATITPLSRGTLDEPPSFAAQWCDADLRRPRRRPGRARYGFRGWPGQRAPEVQ